MVERKDAVLWGTEFPERRDAYLAIARARHTIEVGVKDDFPGRIAEGKKKILGQLGLVNKYPQLDEPWTEAILFAFSRLPPDGGGERQIRDIAESHARDRKREEERALGMLQTIGNDVRALISLMDEATGTLMSPRGKGEDELALEKEIAGLECRPAASSGPEAPQTVKGAACEEDKDSWNEIEAELDREIVSETAETMELIIGEKKARLWEIVEKAEAEWDEKLAQEESLLDAYKEQLVELIGEAAAYARNRGAAVRRGAADVLAEARDARSLILFCYGEIDPDARGAAFRKAVEISRAGPDDSKISMGMRLGREERSMLLRMVEDSEPRIASLAWEFAEWLLDNGKLDGEQLDFVEMQVKDAGDDEVAARVLSKRANVWVTTACGGESEARVSALVKVLEGTWTGLKLDGEQRELLIEFTEDCDAKVSAQAFLLALELCRQGELAPEQVATLVRRANKIEDLERRASTMGGLLDAVPEGVLGADDEWLLAMAAAGSSNGKQMGRGLAKAMEALAVSKPSPERVEELLVLVDSMEPERLDARKKARIFGGVRRLVSPRELTEKAARILELEVEGFAKIFLEVVPSGRTSRLPRRKSDPPQVVKGCAEPQAMKACGGKG